MMEPPAVDPTQIKASILAGIMKELQCDIWYVLLDKRNHHVVPLFFFAYNRTKAIPS